MDSREQTKALHPAFGWTVAATAVVLLLGYIHAGSVALGLPPIGEQLFDLNHEGNVPAWFCALLLFAVAVTMLRAAYLESRRGLATALGWLILGLGFIYLSVDERFALHERLNFLDMGPGLFLYSWVLFAIPGLIVLAVAFIPFLRRIPRLTAKRLVVAGGTFVLGSVVTEMIGGLLSSPEDRPMLVLAISVEETLEMAGVLLALRAVVRHLALVETPALTPVVASGN